MKSFFQEVTKRLSLPADIRLPENFLARSSISLSPDGQLTRRSRRKSLVIHEWLEILPHRLKDIPCHFIRVADGQKAVVNWQILFK